jgi:multiple sugar transport system substrate-binding protein
LETDKFRSILEKYKEVQTIPGNACKGDGPEVTVFQAGTMAMLMGNGARLGEFEEMYNQGKAMNWDMVSYPQFKEAPGKRRQMDVTLLMLTTTSKHPDQAFQAIQAISGKEEQIRRTRQGQMSTFKDPEIRKSFAADYKSAQGKNIQSVFLTEPAALAPYTDYNGIANKYLKTAADDVVKGVDANSALRKANEAANIEIAGLLQGK